MLKKIWSWGNYFDRYWNSFNIYSNNRQAQEKKKLDHYEINFVNDLAEELVFKGWQDESCANFIGWSKDFEDKTIVVHREDAQCGGLYHLGIMKRGYRPSYDYKKYLTSERKNLSLKKIAHIINFRPYPYF